MVTILALSRSLIPDCTSRPRIMLTTSLIFQDAGCARPSALIRELTKLGTSGPFRRLRVAVAYATHSGCVDLISRFQRVVNDWDDLEKRWLISIDFGRTDASALEYLQRLPNSEIRIPSASHLLENNLMPERCFHPKTYIFDCGTDYAGPPYAIFVGSGNLTVSGLRAGVEHGTSLLWSQSKRLSYL
jgi:HKD family nuclease